MGTALGWMLAGVLLAGGKPDETNAWQPPPIAVPEGFAVEVAAAPPLVRHPMMAGFDERGRLFVAEAEGLNLNAEELLAQKPNRIVMLEDTNGDGRFDRSTVFADEMTFPMGALWHEGALYVASPPNIWRLEDTTGDGRADRREAIVGRFGFIGNAADIHGCFLGPNGRIYWCDGRHGHEFVDADGNTLSKGLAARIFSCRADGSDVEAYCGGGMDNPVEIAFSPEGEMFGTMTFYNPDDARHDALVHYVYGGVYPRKHPCVSEFKRTGDFMPPLSLFGVVAPAGMMRYTGAQWGAEYRGNLFSVQFNTHQVVRHVLERDGATYRTTDHEFLVSSSIDFHPTDVLEDADGSLLVIDTGGWFRNGCPTSQVAKPEILGAIYRVRRVGAPQEDDPRGLQLWWDDAAPGELVARLDDRRPAVRERAVATLARQSTSAIAALDEVLRRGDTVTARRNAVWALCRMESPEALEALLAGLDDAEASVRQTAVHSVATHRYRPAVERLLALVVDDEPPVRREAATALGRIGAVEAVPALVESLRRGGDRFLEHAAIYALIEIDTPRAVEPALADTNPAVQRAALVALDQMERGELTYDAVAVLVESDDLALRQAALEVIAARPAWGAEAVERLGEWLTDESFAAGSADLLRGVLLAFSEQDAVQRTAARQVMNDELPLATRELLLEVVALGEPPLADAWVEPIRQVLSSGEDSLRRQAVAIAARTGESRFDDHLATLARDEGAAVPLRRAAVQALVTRRPELDDAEFELLRSGLAEAKAPLERLAAAEALGRAKANAAQRSQLLALLPEVGPLELPALLGAWEGVTDEDAGRQLVAALAASPGLPGVTVERVRATLAGFGDEVQAEAAGLYDRLTDRTGEQAQRLAELTAVTSGGDASRGEAVFFGDRATCAACHRVRGRGGNLGPDLSRIGEVRTERDLLEAIVLPSASLARGYESYTVATTAGEVHTGLIARETPGAIYLVNQERTEIRLAREAIEAIEPSSHSIMPQGLDRVITEGELRDLIAFLRSLK